MQLATAVVAADLARVQADALVIGRHEGAEWLSGSALALDRALDGALTGLGSGGDVSGTLGSVAVYYPRGAVPARRVLLLGLGPAERCTLEVVRRAMALGTARAAELGAASLAATVHGTAVPGASRMAVAQAAVEGSLLASYRFAATRRRAPLAHRITELTLVEDSAADLVTIETGARHGAVIARAVWAARDLVNQPPNVANPEYLAEHARALARRFGMSAQVGDRAWAAGHGMGAFLAVAQGSSTEPAFIVLELNAAAADLPTIVLVGKGVTFDSGGLTLKTRDGMLTMKSDMAGAAAVLGAAQAIAELALPVHLVAICPCVENMPDGAAYRPLDVVVAGNGVSVEIHSTDAEGRLALADALVHAGRYAPDAVVDIATLTGASVTALGAGVCSSLFSPSDELAATVIAAAAQTGERVWRMPLFEEYRDAIDAKVAADLKNTGGANGGVGTSAVFLEAFTSYPWAHVDMAGMALVDRPGTKHYLTPGATGYGVRLLVEVVRHSLSQLTKVAPTLP